MKHHVLVEPEYLAGRWFILKFRSTVHSTSASWAPLPLTGKVLLCIIAGTSIKQQQIQQSAAALSKMLLVWCTWCAPRANVGSAGTKAESLGRSDGPTTAKDPSTTRQKVVWSLWPGPGVGPNMG